MKINSLLVWASLIITTPAIAGLIDHHLRNRLDFYNVRALKRVPENPNRALVELGHFLFEEKKISGNKRISCQTCHDPKMGTSDKFPMSQTENNKGILRRNAQSIFNIGQPTRAFMFWDGRVHLDSANKIFTTPEVALNGENPKAIEITTVLTSALAAQALFPLVTDNEMMGNKGENEIADADGRLEAWDRIIERIKKENPTGINTTTYAELFSRAYPETTLDKINIGHVGEAIAAFQREEFQSTGSPFHQYLRGDNKAMTGEQKRGLAVFLGRGHCINCHLGGELGRGDLFASAAVPQWGAIPFTLDKGQAEVINDQKRNFFYKVPSLVNLKLTAPYMHNGAFQTIREVIEHYNHLDDTLKEFSVSAERRAQIPVPVTVANHPLILDDIWLSSQSGITPELKNRLRLSDEEKDDLETFLKEALTDPRWGK